MIRVRLWAKPSYSALGLDRVGLPARPAYNLKAGIPTPAGPFTPASPHRTNDPLVVREF
jgi:hypothetical protein